MKRAASIGVGGADGEPATKKQRIEAYWEDECFKVSGRGADNMELFHSLIDLNLANQHKMDCLLYGAVYFGNMEYLRELLSRVDFSKRAQELDFQYILKECMLQLNLKIHDNPRNGEFINTLCTAYYKFVH